MDSTARTIQARVLARREEAPERPSIAFVDGRGGFRWWSRADFLARALRASGRLAELGLEPGGACVVVSVDPAECATSVLAILMRGGVPVLVAPPAIQGASSHLREVVIDVVRRTGARVALLSRSMADVAAEVPAARLELGFERLLSEGGREALPELRAPDDVAAMQLTSGTTGFPRIAVWEQRRLLAALDGMAAGMDVTPDDVYLNWTPLYHDMGLVNNFLLCQVHGIPLALMSPLDVVRRPALWLRALHAVRATTTWSPNFGYALALERIRDDELAGVRLDGVRGFWNAAERVHLETFEHFHRRFEPLGVPWEACKSNFGCVETVGGVTFTAPGTPLVAERVDVAALQSEGVAIETGGAARSTKGAQRRTDANGGARAQWIVSSGRPCPGVEAGAFDAAGRPLPDGAVGELGFRTKARFVEYLADPAETALAVRGEHVFPGDLGYVRGGEVFWTGRARERINLQGRKIDPSELEPVLFAIDGLRKGSFAAFGVEDVARGTEVLVVVAEVADEAGDRARIAGDVCRATATQLGVTIEELVLVRKGALTKTSSGKRRHRRVRELYLAGALQPLHRSGAGRLG